MFRNLKDLSETTYHKTDLLNNKCKNAEDINKSRELLDIHKNTEDINKSTELLEIKNTKDFDLLSVHENIIIDNNVISTTKIVINSMDTGVILGQKLNNVIFKEVCEGSTLSETIIETHNVIIDSNVTLNNELNETCGEIKNNAQENSIQLDERKVDYKYFILGTCIGLLGCGALYYCYKNNYLPNLTTPEVTQTVTTTIEKTAIFGVTVGETTTTVITDILTKE